MTVYVDNYRHRLGRMLMSHMIADTEAEMHAMAAKIGVTRRHYQGDHYDVCEHKRLFAIQRHGAVAITPRAMAKLRRRLMAGERGRHRRPLALTKTAELA